MKHYLVIRDGSYICWLNVDGNDPAPCQLTTDKAFAEKNCAELQREYKKYKYEVIEVELPLTPAPEPDREEWVSQ